MIRFKQTRQYCSPEGFGMKKMLMTGFLIVANAAMCASVAAAADPATNASMPPSLATTIAAMPKNLVRAKAPDLEASIGAARAAVLACAQQGAKVSVLVADVNGKPVVLLSGDGAGVRSQLIAQTKANIVARYRMSSEAVAQRAKTDAELARQAASDPDIGMLRGGGLPVHAGSELIGIVAVSGAGLNGDLRLDEKCARVAVAMLEPR